MKEVQRMTVFGNIGKLLRINLSTSRITVEQLPKDVAHKFLGGKCLGAKLLYDEVRPGINPLGPENRLIFAAGPLQGTTIPGSGRFVVISKSALTNGFGEAHGGGTFGPFMKMAGYDVIVVEGMAERPVYVEVSSDNVSIENAARIGGKDVWETEKALKETRRGLSSIVSIGPAGERLVRFAAIMNDLHRSAARSGVGAIMGSKRLKAILINLDRAKWVEVAEEAKLREYIRDVTTRIKALPAMIDRGKNGTSSLVEAMNAYGILPTKNFQEGFFSKADSINAEALNSILVGRKACYACPIACGRLVEVKNGPFASVHRETGGPEYETLAAFGSLLLNDSLEAIVKANEFCNIQGIDTISAGIVIAYCMECYEKGILTSKDLGGLDLKWGDAKAMLKLLEMIASREGIGDTLAEGVKKASESIGKDSKCFAMHVKGQELPLHEGRGKKAVGFLYAVGSAGAKHLEAEHDTAFERENVSPELGIKKPISRLSLKGQAARIKVTQELWSLVDSLILCKFLAPIRAISILEMVELTNLATGRDYSLQELLRVGERAIILGRIFNAREGFGRKDDYLPSRFYEPLKGGVSAGAVFTQQEFEEGLNEYYEMRGLDIDTGRPTRTKLLELGLDDVAERALS